MGFPGGSDVKNLPAMQRPGLMVWYPGQQDPLEKGMATYSHVLAWKIPWTEESGGIQSMGSQRVKHNWATNTFTFHFHQCIKNEWPIPKGEWVSDMLLSERNQTPERAHSIICSRMSSRIAKFGTSLVVWWLRLCTSIAGGHRFNPWSGN